MHTELDLLRLSGQPGELTLRQHSIEHHQSLDPAGQRPTLPEPRSVP
jgi:hypothetical protein